MSCNLHPETTSTNKWSIIKKYSGIPCWVQEEKKLQKYKWSRNRKNVKIAKRPKSSGREKSEPCSGKTIKQLRKSRKKTPKQMSHKIKDTKENLAQDQPWESVAEFSNVVYMPSYVGFTTAKKSCCKGFHIFGLSFQILQCCW